MNEILIVGGQKKKQNVILEVDATRQSLGSTNLIDWSGNNTFSLVGSGAKIADVTGIGRVMDFTVGSSFFQTGGPVDLSTEPMIIDVIFQSINSSAIQMVWCTGDYSSRIVAGLGHYAMVGVGGHQLFPTDAPGNFVRCSINGTVSQVFDLTIQTDPVAKTISIKNNTSGLIQNYNVPFWFGIGERLSVGSSYVGTGGYGLLKGYVKKLVISKVG